MAKDNIQLCYSKLLDTLRMFVFEESSELEYFKVKFLIIFINISIIK